MDRKAAQANARDLHAQPALVNIRVFVVDDHPIVREGLRRLFENGRGLEFVGEAGSGEEATEQIATARPDVVILDVALPGIDGAQTTRLLRQLSPKVKVIALTIHEDRSYMRELFEAGASGYVVKRAAVEELLHAVRTVSANGVYVDPRVAGNLISSFVSMDSTPTGVARLTDRESRVLRRVAEGYSNKEIAGELGLSIKTVETYKTRAMEKLSLHDRVDIVRYAARHGWLAGR
jgi:DNA-binding NarL/FixJ family response regulator